MSAKSIVMAAAGASGPATYIEDVFSTYLYTGNGSSQTITNGIDLAGKGGLIWAKIRSTTQNHILTDTARGLNTQLNTNSAGTGTTSTSAVTSFGSTGFSTGTGLNTLYAAYATWTFRKQPKFFDIVTYTGNGTTQTISHSLGGTVGCVIVKRTTGGADDWYVWHRSTASGNYLKLNSTNAQSSSSAANIFGNNTTTVDPTSTNFTVGNIAGVNASGSTYVAYLFAHDAGGFGTAGTDNVISCGTFTGQTTVTLGWEPQWILRKRTDVAGDWFIHDTMRGFPSNNSASTAETAFLNPNLTDAESTTTNRIFPSATGFTTGSGLAGETYIYIAIRRGPMKTPTSGTSVFNPVTYTGDNTDNRLVSLGVLADGVMARQRDVAADMIFSDRLRANYMSFTNRDYDEKSYADGLDQQLVGAVQYGNSFSDMTGFYVGNSASTLLNQASTPQLAYAFRRAPGFFDVVCYTGTGSSRTVTHNLGVAPELLLVKARNNLQNWGSLCTLSGGLQGRLNSNAAFSAPSAAVWGNGTSYVAPTSTVFTVGSDNETNASTWTYVAYLFASCPGVSKVGTYTGNGSTQTINCGFTSGARFVMIKRTNSTGDWYVWDTARGIIAANDPHLSLNTTVAEVTTNDSIDPDSTGFIVNQVAATNINVSSATYIYLAIA